MRERVTVSDLTTLFVCPSRRWGTIERRAIADSVFFRDLGGNSIIFCVKDSYIDFEAQLQDISTIYYTGSKVNEFFDLSYLIDIRNLLNERRFDIIHCYELSYVWKISFFLMSNPQIPLFLSFNSFLNKSYKNFVQRWLFKRIDNVITYSNATKEIVVDYLPISSRKIKIAGAGVEVLNKKEPKESAQRLVGCFINKSKNTLKKLSPILYSINPLLQDTRKIDLDLKFIFYSEDNWKELSQFSKIESIINELGISEWVSFEVSHKREHAIQKLDVFIGTEFEEPFNDFEVMALLCSIPVVIPRTASRQELLTSKLFIGESYHRYDSREIKDKVLKILKNEKVYLAEISENNEFLSSEHGLDLYWQRLTELYESSVIKRLRVSKKIKSSK